MNQSIEWAIDRSSEQGSVDDWFKVVRPTWHKIGHIGDLWKTLPKLSLSCDSYAFSFLSFVVMQVLLSGGVLSGCDVPLLLPTPKAVTRLGFCSSICVCVFYHMISRKPMQLRSPNLTKLCSTMNPRYPFIFGQNVKGRGHKSQKTLPVCVLRFCEYWLLVLHLFSYSSLSFLASCFRKSLFPIYPCFVIFLYHCCGVCRELTWFRSC